MIDPTFIEQYGAALGFSVIFLAMIGVLWSYHTAQAKIQQERYDAMLREQQTRYDNMLKDEGIRYDKLQEKYLVDLAGGTALNVRYTRQMALYEDDTQVRRSTKSLTPNLSQSEIDEAKKLMDI